MVTTEQDTKKGRPESTLSSYTKFQYQSKQKNPSINFSHYSLIILNFLYFCIFI